MQKAYSRIEWENYPSTDTPLNETNLNKMDVALNTVDNRVVEMDTTKANQSDLLTALWNVTYNTSTGVFTFTWKNGTSTTFDLNIEKIPVSFSMNESGVITMITADGTEYTADVSAILKVYTFSNSSTIGWTVTQNGNNYTVSADIVNGSVTASKLQPNYLADVTAQANNASTSAGTASTQALAAEGYANGTQNGTPVDSSSPYYQNNAKYWKDEAQQAAGGGVTSFNGRNGSVVPQAGDYSSFYCATDDSRLSDARPASDVSSWAKQPTKPSYNASEIGAGTLGGKTQANATAMATLSDAQVRDVIISTTDLTAGVSPLATGTVYIVYEA